MTLSSALQILILAVAAFSSELSCYMFLTLALPVTVDMDDGRAGEMPTLAAEMPATQPAYPKEQAEKLFSNRDLH